MALELTTRALAESQKTTLQPNLVLVIEGYSDVLGAIPIQRIIRIGDTGLLIGDSWTIGGLINISNQQTVLSFNGSSGKIQQQIDPDKGSVSSISSIQMELVDFGQRMTQLISPSVELTDILGVRAKVLMGFNNTAYPDDYVKVFAGFIDEVQAGPTSIIMNIAHPDLKKRQDVFIKATAKLTSAINNSVTTIPLTAVVGFGVPVLGPDGVTYDSSITRYVRIEDEIIKYTGISALNLTGCVRAQLGTLSASHAIDSDVNSITALEGQANDLALKFMLSGLNGPYVSALDVASFVQVPPTSSVANAVYFSGVFLETDYNVQAGDYITTSGALNGANNVSNKVILSVTETDLGSYAVISGVTFVSEATSPAVMSIRSQYDTLGDGLALTPQEVDIAEHVYWRDLILSSYFLRFYLKDTVKGTDWLNELYKQIGGYSIPRKGKCSMGYHLGPLPRQAVPTLNKDNIKNPSKIKLKRSVNRNFYNTIIYAFDESPTEDKFLAGYIVDNEDSKNRITMGTKSLRVDAKGFRTDLSGNLAADRAANRYLSRYKFAAEYIEGLEVFFKSGFTVEPGDIVIFDPDGLYIANTDSGDRTKPAKLFEVINKSIDLHTGATTLNIVDSNYSGQERFGLISPSSKLASGSTTTILNITESFEQLFTDEALKWDEFVGLPIRVHSYDYTYDQSTTLVSIDANDRHKLTVSPALATAPLVNYIVDIPDYPTSTDKAEDNLYKLLFAHLSPTVTVTSGTSGTQFSVGAGDIAKFFVGGNVIVHSSSYSSVSELRKITDITGLLITVDSTLGFTPSAGYLVDSIGFADKQAAYTYI